MIFAQEIVTHTAAAVDWAIVLQSLAELTGLVFALTAAVFAAYRRWFKAWAASIEQRTASTDNAVNDGRMARVEKNVARGAERADRIESRLDVHADHDAERLEHIEKRLDQHSVHVAGRFTNIEQSQRDILAAIVERNK